MFKLRDELVKRLELLPNVKVAFWKDTDLLCVLHKDKEVAHFQNGHEIDIRLTPAIIKKRGLHPPQDTASHLWTGRNVQDGSCNLLCRQKS